MISEPSDSAAFLGDRCAGDGVSPFTRCAGDLVCKVSGFNSDFRCVPSGAK
jgi:hypothetical protein